MAADPPPNPLTTASAPKLNQSENENEIETKTSSATEQIGKTLPLSEAQDTAAAMRNKVTEQADESTSVNNVDEAMTNLTLQDHSITVKATLTAHSLSADRDVNHPPIGTIVPTLGPSSSSSTTTTKANASPRQSPPPATFPAQDLIPLQAEHYPPTLPFEVCPDTVNVAHPIWTLSMRLCDYSPASIKQAHYFTKSVVYYPDWKIRVISKNEHRLVQSSSSSTSTPSTDTDTATSTRTDTPTPISHISTRPLWAMQFYYGGPPRPPWDEVVPASWTGAELDTVTVFQRCCIEKIIELIAQAQRQEVRADTGREVKVVSDSQLGLGMEMGSLAEGEGRGDGGAFAVAMSRLSEECEWLEGLIGKVDAGGPRNWEAERDLWEGVRKYAR